MFGKGMKLIPLPNIPLPIRLNLRAAVDVFRENGRIRI